MGIGLTFDEWLGELYAPWPNSDVDVLEAAREGHEKSMFPMNVVVASGHLRSRGYDCRPEMLELLVANGTVQLSAHDAWNQADVDAAAEYFEDCQMYVPYAAMCLALGCRYADFKRALREAAQRETQKYGRHVRDDDQLFVMHRVPPRGVTGDDGDLVSITPAVITFTLCDDIRERLERGEEV